MSHKPSPKPMKKRIAPPRGPYSSTHMARIALHSPDPLLAVRVVDLPFPYGRQIATLTGPRTWSLVKVHESARIGLRTYSRLSDRRKVIA